MTERASLQQLCCLLTTRPRHVFLGLIRTLCLSLIVAAITAGAADAGSAHDHVLAVTFTQAGAFLERLDARTLHPLTKKSVFVAKGKPIDWDFSPDGKELLVASNKARVVDLATFRVRTECCLPFPVSDPAWVALLWTKGGVEVVDDGGGTWDLHGRGKTLNGPFGLAGFAKGPAGLVELIRDSPPVGAVSWWLNGNRGFPELDGEPQVAMAVDGRQIYLMTPAGRLISVVDASETSGSVSLPPTVPVFDFRITAWSPGLLIAWTTRQLVLVNPHAGTAQPLPLDATDFATGPSDLAVWNKEAQDGLFVYDRAGGERLHLLPSNKIGCVVLHNRFAYVAASTGGGCSRTRSIFDLQSGELIGHASAPTYLIG